MWHPSHPILCGCTDILDREWKMIWISHGMSIRLSSLQSDWLNGPLTFSQSDVERESGIDALLPPYWVIPLYSMTPHDSVLSSLIAARIELLCDLSGMLSAMLLHRTHYFSHCRTVQFPHSIPAVSIIDWLIEWIAIGDFAFLFPLLSMKCIFMIRRVSALYFESERQQSLGYWVPHRFI